MNNPDLDFSRACFKESNKLRREAAAEFNRLLASFLCLGLLLILLACAGIVLRWSPGQPNLRQAQEHVGLAEVKP